MGRWKWDRGNKRHKGSYKKHERGDMEGSCVGFKGDISLWQVQLKTCFSIGVYYLLLMPFLKLMLIRVSWDTKSKINFIKFHVYTSLIY